MTQNRQPVGMIDTNIVIRLSELAAEALPARMLVSCITIAELAVGPAVSENDSERETRQRHLDETRKNFDPRPFDDAAALAFGRVAADLRTAGRKATARTFDALIAAAAISENVPLYTANPDDFTSISDLVVVPVK